MDAQEQTSAPSDERARSPEHVVPDIAESILPHRRADRRPMGG